MNVVTLSPQQAINILDQATANMQGDRKAHEMVIMALNCLRAAHPNRKPKEGNETSGEQKSEPAAETPPDIAVSPAEHKTSNMPAKKS